ncbi:hypothetical protein BRL84_06805 [Xanthomonas oryzae pv. oryzae]|nr:hypothetical protein BRL84_06805 [Xanthomonas oryzae pv. oryzae]
MGFGIWDLGFGIWDLGFGSRESGVGSRESGVGSRESGVGSRESGVGSRDWQTRARSSSPHGINRWDEEVTVEKRSASAVANPQSQSSNPGYNNTKSSRCTTFSP